MSTIYRRWKAELERADAMVAVVRAEVGALHRNDAEMLQLVAHLAPDHRFAIGLLGQMAEREDGR
jgi:hypothetical protein